MRSKRLPPILAALVVLVAAVAGGLYLYERNRTGNIYHPRARFVPQATPSLPASAADRFAWPFWFAATGGSMADGSST